MKRGGREKREGDEKRWKGEERIGEGREDKKKTG